MSLIPAFELGLWNAWIFFVLHQGGTSILLQLMYKGGVWKDVMDVWKKSSTDYLSNKPDRRLDYLVYVIAFVGVGYSVFLPLKLGTVWFYVGLFIYLLGVIIDFMASVSWATNPLDKPITTGIYSISRNPMDFGNFVALVGTSIA
jgi:protein-S-isoprenylcysteine O-methyltransferase Ste14